MATKQEFYNSISDTTLLDEDFWKKVYGYSYLDREFSTRVTDMLTMVWGVKDAEERYTAVAKRIDREYDIMLKEVAVWQRKRNENQYEKQERQVNATNERRNRYKFTGFPQSW